MSMIEEYGFPGLAIADDALRTGIQATMAVKAVVSSDYKGWEERLLDPKNSPVPHMRTQRQVRNDCQGQALANGEEKRHWYVTGDMVQFSDTYAYNASEYAGRPANVGNDQGTSIESGVRVLTQGLVRAEVAPGLPLESAWAYDTYERNYRRFVGRAKSAQIVETNVTQHGEMPDWEGALVAMAAGGSIHIGTYWPAAWSNVSGTGKRLMYKAPTSGGGHATEIVWAHKIDGVWYLLVWNSHGDQFYYMSQQCYEQLQRIQCRPFGGYLLMPSEPERIFESRVSPWRFET